MRADFKRVDKTRLQGGTGAPATGGAGDVASEVHERIFVPLTTGTGAPQGARAHGAMNSQIDGRDLVRAGLRTGAIGGPNKNFAGVINGTNFRPRHP
jgi:hypothetical protein